MEYSRQPTDEELAKRPFLPTLLGDRADFEEAWKYFVWMEACDWKHLPNAGGLADQDEMLMENVFAITSFVRKVRKNE